MSIKMGLWRAASNFETQNVFAKISNLVSCFQRRSIHTLCQVFPAVSRQPKTFLIINNGWQLLTTGLHDYIWIGLGWMVTRFSECGWTNPTINSTETLHFTQIHWKNSVVGFWLWSLRHSTHFTVNRIHTEDQNVREFINNTTKYTHSLCIHLK